MPASRFIFGSLPWYSVLVTTGILVAFLLCSAEEKRLQLPKDTAVDFALMVIPLGVIGARIYYVLFSWEAYRNNPISALYIWEGGLAIYGAVIGGILGAWILARRKKISLLSLLDMVSPGLVLAQGIGRWGNFFNMEAYGEEITSRTWQFFPAAVQIGEKWHMATFFYESAADVAIFLGLWLTRGKRTRKGDTFLCYLLLYGAARFVIEGLRTDSLYGFAGLRVSQVLSMLMCLAVCLVCAWRCKPACRWLLLLPALGVATACAPAMAGAGTGLRTLGAACFSLLAITACGLMIRRKCLREGEGDAQREAC
ncbi:MAG: prolipoprotein diacylglyceryl transferase [Clostridia bacterium]|nr:prolipoprotein diacylglyceryl transferase [Clostridia bacterium]